MSQSVETLDEIVERYPGQPEYLIFMLQDIQSTYGYISEDSMKVVCDYSGVPLTQGYSVATFYQSFRLDPRGEHEVRVCLGTACHLKGGQRIVEEVERRLNVAAGGTTEDLRYTLSTVNCVGACALAPVVVVDEEYLSNMTAKKLEKHLKTLDYDLENETKEHGHV
ncbi:MAG: NAD(P)H-dependent oxidoreductase subunit E [Desulfobacteraceae bacterium]|nr:NAD(P)H-dependent oxidoreductase subunit E [Desulfobacteraceae bacterium]